MDEAEDVEQPVPVIVGAGGLSGRPLLPPRYPDEYEQPDPDAPRRKMGQAMPSNCRRVMSLPNALTCTPGCEGRQRDGGCLCDVVRAAQEARARWSFEVDPHDHFWDYAGEQIPGFVFQRGNYGQTHTRWEEGHEPPAPDGWQEPPPPPEFDCPHCGAHNEQDLSNFHWWCAACGRNAKETT